MKKWSFFLLKKDRTGVINIQSMIILQTRGRIDKMETFTNAAIIHTKTIIFERTTTDVDVII
jgi:hypothetical protein